LPQQHLDFETLHHFFGHASNKVICYVFDNIKDIKKTCFPTYKYICFSCILEKIYQHSFPENSIHFSELLELIHSDFLKLPTLSYLKYKWVIIFLDDYFFYHNIAFLCKKSEVAKAIKSILQMWSNITFHSIKRLHLNNKGKYIISEL